MEICSLARYLSVSGLMAIHLKGDHSDIVNSETYFWIIFDHSLRHSRIEMDENHVQPLKYHICGWMNFHKFLVPVILV